MAQTYGDIITGGIVDSYNWLMDTADNVVDSFSNLTEGIQTPEIGIWNTPPGEYFTTDNWFPNDNDTGMTLIPEGVYESDYFKDTPAGPVPDIFKPPVPVVSDVNPVYGPINNPNLTTTTPYVSTPRDGTAITERPWKDEEIDVHAVGTHNSGDRGYDSVGNLKEGWKLGIDGVPYNTALFALNDAAIAAAGGGGGGGYGSGGGGSSAPAASLFQDLSQRTPSGTQYAPDLSAYNDSSLFNYTGPGGLSEYTYGQGLPYQGAGYDIWGTPTDMVNPYYTGQFATEQAAGVADGAISLPPVDMPAGVAPTNNNPNVGTSNANIVPQGTGPGGKDLTYQETLDYFNLNPYAQSTTFPSPGGSNPSLADRQRAQIGAEKYDAMVAQADAWDRQMREGQLGSGFKGEEELNKDVQKVILDNEPLDQVIYDYNRENPTPENFWSTRTQEERDALDARALNAITAEDLRDGLFAYERDPKFNYYNEQGKQGNIVSDPQYSIANDAFTLNMLPQKNNANVDSEGNLINRTPPERSIWKDDEINIPTPLKPAGVEGEDYWQSTQGGYYSVDDDLGLEPLVMSQPFSAEEAAERARVEAELYWDDSPKIDLDVAANKVGTPITVTRTPAPAMTNVGPAGSGVIPTIVPAEPSLWEKSNDWFDENIFNFNDLPKGFPFRL